MYEMTTSSLVTLDGLTLTEHNRKPMTVDYEHLNRSERTVEGYMRRQHIASKRSFSVSWDELPHTSAYTVDRKSGAQEMIAFFATRMNKTMPLIIARHSGTSTETVTVLIESFDYEVSKRYEFEYWNLSLSLVEV